MRLTHWLSPLRRRFSVPSGTRQQRDKHSHLAIAPCIELLEQRCLLSTQSVLELSESDLAHEVSTDASAVADESRQQAEASVRRWIVRFNTEA